MTLNPFARRPAASEDESDRSIPVVVFFLLALVFVPVIGVHIAFAAFGPPAASAQTDPNHSFQAGHPKPLRE